MSAAAGRYLVPSPRPHSHTTLKVVIYLTCVCMHVCVVCAREQSPIPEKCSQRLWFSLQAKPTCTLPEADSEQTPLMSRV